MKSFKTLADLTGRTALITGGAGHLGRAFGRVLGELGASVALADKDREGLNQVRSELQKNIRCEIFTVELAQEDNIRKLLHGVAETFGGIDIVINNAGFVGTNNLTGWSVPFENQSRETWRECLEVNLTSSVFLIQAALPWLRTTKRGSIINIGSIYGFLGPDMRLYEKTEMGNPAAYGASKAGLIQMTRWLATALAPDIRVNCISPGGIWRDQPQVFLEKYESRTPLGRMATEEDLIGAVAFLASDLSQYMTGQHLVLDGGWSAW